MGLSYGILRHLGPCWGRVCPAEGVLGLSWGVFGPSWGVLGPSWDRLVASEGGFVAVFGRLGAVLGRLGGILGRLSAVAESSWGQVTLVGSLSGPSWSTFGSSYSRIRECIVFLQ